MKKIISGLLGLCVAAALSACQQPLSPIPLPGYPCYVELVGTDGRDTLVPVKCEGRIPVRAGIDS